MKPSRPLFHSRIARIFAATSAACLLTSGAQAHEVWIEDTPSGDLVVRFAEYGDKLETSPGALDSLTLPFAWTPSIEKPAAKEAEPAPAAKAEPDAAAKPAGKSIPSREAQAIRDGKVDSFDVQKKTDHFLLVNAKPAQAAQVETGFTVMGKQGDPEKPARKPYFYARWQPPGAGPAQPGLNFDIVPTGQPGEARVFLRGKPLADAKLKLYPPAEAEVELTSDANGLVKFPSSKPGLYMLAGARQRETTPGFFGGKGYDVMSHNCSLSWRQP